MMRRHPSKKRLRDWLGGTEESLDDHLATCERCAVTLEEMEAADTDGSLRTALSEVLQPPADLLPRLEQNVATRLDSRKMFGFMADMFGAGFETARLLATDPYPEPPPEELP